MLSQAIEGGEARSMSLTVGGEWRMCSFAGVSGSRGERGRGRESHWQLGGWALRKPYEKRSSAEDLWGP